MYARFAQRVLLPSKKFAISKVFASYNYFGTEWVLDVEWWQHDNSRLYSTLVVGKMCHSYSSKIPLRPWVIIKSSGSVVCGHCTSKAGQGKTCSDAKAVLTWSDANARVIDRTPCTSKKKPWIELNAFEGYDAIRYWFHFCQEQGEVHPWMWRDNNFFSNCAYPCLQRMMSCQNTWLK